MSIKVTHLNLSRLNVIFFPQNTWENDIITLKGHTFKCCKKRYFLSQKYLNLLNCYLCSSTQCYSSFRGKLVKCTSSTNSVCPSRKPKECSKLGQKNHFGESGRGSKSLCYRSLVNTRKLGQKKSARYWSILASVSSLKAEKERCRGQYWYQEVTVLPFKIICLEWSNMFWLWLAVCCWCCF